MTTLFQRASNPLWFFLDLNAKPFDDTFFMFVLSNTIPYLPLVVYHDVLGTIPWDNPIQFGPNAALPEDIFWDPSEVYRLEFRKGNTQADALIYLVDQYTVNGNSITPPSSSQIIMSDNLLTNPQFSNVNFNTTIGFTSGSSSAQLQIAPGWFLTMDNSVTGVTVSQVAFQGSNDIVNNPSYAISIASTGTGNVELIQQFNNNGGLWGSTVNGSTAVPSSLAFNVTASSTTAVTLHAEIVYSNSSNAPVDLTDSLLNNSYVEYQGGSSNLPASTNTDPASTAYTQLEMYWAAGGTVTITNVQLIQELTATFFPVNYIQLPIERQIDQEYHVNQANLISKPIPSFLTGWDFPLNPAQFNTHSVAPQAPGSNTSYYAWDQTILFQANSGSITTSQSASGALVLTATTASITQMAIIQYIPRNVVARRLLDGSLAANIAAYTSQSNGLTATVSIWYTTSTLPSLSSNNSIVATLDINGHPATTNGSWTELTRISNVGNAQFTIAQKVNEAFFDYGFNGWDILGSTNLDTVTYLAIVVGTGIITVGNSVSFLSVSLNNSNTPTRPAPQTYDQVLRECQYFYQMSYAQGTKPGTASTTANAKFATQPVQTSSAAPSLKFNAYNGDAILEYQQEMIGSPALTFYSPVTGNTAVVLYNVNTNGTVSTAVGELSISNGGNPVYKYAPFAARTLINATATNDSLIADTLVLPSAYITYHYTASARLGLEITS